jgi:hypothetical protein
MTETMTTKQVAERVRKLLAQPGSGLRFSVRATRTGINITIHDDGYVNQVTGGDREKFSKQEHGTPVIKRVDSVRQMFDPPLPGKTTWAPIIISARVTSVTRVGPGGEIVADCDRCGAAIYRGGTRHTLASSRGVEELCGDCHSAELDAALGPQPADPLF